MIVDIISGQEYEEESTNDSPGYILEELMSNVSCYFDCKEAVSFQDWRKAVGLIAESSMEVDWWR